MELGISQHGAVGIRLYIYSYLCLIGGEPCAKPSSTACDPSQRILVSR